MNEILKVTGTVKAIAPLEQIATKSGKPLTKRRVLLTIGDKYPQDIPFEFVNDKTTLVDNIKQGSQQTFCFNLKAYTYEGKVRMSEPQVWKIENGVAAAPSQPSAPQFAGMDSAPAPATTSDLPF